MALTAARATAHDERADMANECDAWVSDSIRRHGLTQFMLLRSRSLRAHVPKLTWNAVMQAQVLLQVLRERTVQGLRGTGVAQVGHPLGSRSQQ